MSSAHSRWQRRTRLRMVSQSPLQLSAASLRWRSTSCTALFDVRKLQPSMTQGSIGQASQNGLLCSCGAEQTGLLSPARIWSLSCRLSLRPCPPESLSSFRSHEHRHQQLASLRSARQLTARQQHHRWRACQRHSRAQAAWER